MRRRRAARRRTRRRRVDVEGQPGDARRAFCPSWTTAAARFRRTATPKFATARPSTNRNTCPDRAACWRDDGIAVLLHTTRLPTVERVRSRPRERARRTRQLRRSTRNQYGIRRVWSRAAARRTGLPGSGAGESTNAIRARPAPSPFVVSRDPAHRQRAPPPPASASLTTTSDSGQTAEPDGSSSARRTAAACPPADRDQPAAGRAGVGKQRAVSRARSAVAPVSTRDGACGAARPHR